MNDQSSSNETLLTDFPFIGACDRETVLTVYAVLVATIPDLVRGIEYRSDQLLGSEIWDNSSPDDHKILGNIVGRLVRLEYVPLIKVGRSSSNMAQYSLL